MDVRSTANVHCMEKVNLTTHCRGRTLGSYIFKRGNMEHLPETVALPCIIELPLQPFGATMDNGASALTTTYLISEDTIEATLL